MTNPLQASSQEIRSQLSVGEVLRYYGGKCVNKSSGAWLRLVHGAADKGVGHKTPSLAAKDSSKTATCMSHGYFASGDIFWVIVKMKNLDIGSNLAKNKDKNRVNVECKKRLYCG